jgi:hypothetical protein
MGGAEGPRDASQDPAFGPEVVLILAGARVEIPGYWSVELDVRDEPTRLLGDGRVLRRRTLESCARQAFAAQREILDDGNYRISLSGDPATIDFLEIMRATLLVTEGQRAIEIVIAEEQEVVEKEPAPGETPQVLERRVVYRRLGHPEEALPEGMVVFDLSDDGGSDERGSQIPVQIPGARVIGWRGLRNRYQMRHESYASAAARSLVERSARLCGDGARPWGIYVGRQAQRACAVLRESRGFYAGRMIPILVRQQWRKDVEGAAPSWRPLGLRLLEHTRVA